MRNDKKIVNIKQFVIVFRQGFVCIVPGIKQSEKKERELTNAETMGYKTDKRIPRNAEKKFPYNEA